MKFNVFILLGLACFVMVSGVYALSVGIDAGVNDLVILTCYSDSDCDDGASARTNEPYKNPSVGTMA